jgi:hypothetical protein
MLPWLPTGRGLTLPGSTCNTRQRRWSRLLPNYNNNNGWFDNFVAETKGPLSAFVGRILSTPDDVQGVMQDSGGFSTARALQRCECAELRQISAAKAGIQQGEVHVLQV